MWLTHGQEIHLNSILLANKFALNLKGVDMSSGALSDFFDNIIYIFV